jgi:acetolactate synthase-1/2/3 large subunit
MKASDYFAQLMAGLGIGHAYGLQGGAVVHLFDSLEKTGSVRCVYMHHEESAALAAVASAKVSKKPGLAVVTTGPGGTNALTGLLAAWQDSVPVIFVSGQVRLDTTSYGKNVRQIASQEFAILDVVKPMTKYCALIRSTADIGRVFAEAADIARSGRPGPVWIDFPLDIQWQEMTPDPAVQPAASRPVIALTAGQETQLDALARDLRVARRPLVFAGHGVHLGDVEAAVTAFCERHHIPLVATWGGSDLMPSAHPLNGGVVGLSGQRGANQLVFQCDLLLVLGANLTQTQVGAAKLPYAPQARRIAITHDRNQLAASTVKLDDQIDADLGLSLARLETLLAPQALEPAWGEAVSTARLRNRKGSVDLDSRDLLPSGLMSTNIAIHLLSDHLQHTHQLVVDGGGTALYAGFQSAVRGVGRRIVCSTGISSMGTGLAETLGVSLSLGRCPVLTIIGDGSFLMNIQDLASLAQHRIPAAVAIVNNDGYLAIKHTQRDYLGGRFYGTNGDYGMVIPPFGKIVEGFGLRYREITTYEQLEAVARELAIDPTGLVLDLKVDPDQDVLFRQAVSFNANGTSTPHDLSEMWPFTPTA